MCGKLGVQPKCSYCSTQCRRAAQAERVRQPPLATLRPCVSCGQEFRPTYARSLSRYCSDLCRPDQRGPLRRAYEERDPETFFAALVCQADTATDCWIWPKLNDGYPVLRVRGRDLPLHRAVLEMKHDAPLGSQAAHHACANTACVNPDHLQPVTHRENIAEMLSRQSYLARIRELEAALAMVAPDHPLLAVIEVA